MNKEKKNGILSGIFWTYGESMAAQLITLFVSIVLARIIEPHEYGIIALIMVFITLANVFVTDGFGNALIQKKDADDKDFSTVFWFGIFVSSIVYSVLFIISPIIAAYYNMPLLNNVMRVMGLRIPIASINSIQRAYISKRMEFKKFFFSTIIGTLLSGVVGIWMALLGFGVWSIVVQFILNAFIDTIVLYMTTGWKPHFIFSNERLRPLFAFGSRVLCVSFMNSLYSNLRNLIIGKQYSASDLAYSNKAQSFPSLISANINSSIVSVIFPAISKIQDDKKEVLRLSRKVICVGTYLLAPLMFGMAVVAPEFITIVLTKKWIACVPYMRIMCFVYLLQPIQHASIQAMKALGESKLYLHTEIIKKMVGIFVLVTAIVVSENVWGIVFSALIAEIISTVINFPINKKIINYSYRDQLMDIGKPVLMASFMYLTAVFAAFGLNKLFRSELFICIMEILAGMITYIIISVVLKDSSFNYIKNLICEIRGKRVEK